jgi:hypothetical protein
MRSRFLSKDHLPACKGERKYFRKDLKDGKEEVLKRRRTFIEHSPKGNEAGNEGWGSIQSRIFDTA